MKNYGIYSIFILLLFSACKNEKEVKNEDTAMTIGLLTLSTDQPKPGQTVDIAYKSPEETEAVFTYLVGTNNYPVDIELSKSNDEQIGTIKIPDSAQALAFLFKLEDTYDNNEKKGYLIPLYTDDGDPLAGSNASIALYANYYGANYGIKMEDDDIVEAIKADIAAHPDLKDDWYLPYLYLEYKRDKDAAKQLISEYISTLSEKTDISEKDYNTMMQLYGVTKQQTKLDSVKTITIEKYPNGQTANSRLVDAFFEETDLEKKVEIFKNYKNANHKLGNMGEYLTSMLATSYFNNGDMVNFEIYSNMVEDKSSKASSLNNLAWALAEKGANLEAAEKISKQSLDLIDTLQKNPKDKPDYYSQKQYEKSLDFSYRMYADTYALILFKQGKVKEAISYQEKAHDPKAKDPEANARYIEYLMADKQYEKVINKSETFIALGNGNDKLKKQYKTAYQKVNANADDFEDKLIALEAKARENAMADIKKSMLDEDAPQFTLKDMKGDMVSLESLKGKIVILDFWATWCGPCKASFPGMQRVVTKYKDDDNVKLLFVDTFESGDDREKNVEDYINKSKYDFHVIYDTEDSTIAGKYGVTGIPTKIVIGTDGRMKFKSVGYSGSSDKLVDEMDIMIAALKS